VLEKDLHVQCVYGRPVAECSYSMGFMAEVRVLTMALVLTWWWWGVLGGGTFLKVPTAYCSEWVNDTSYLTSVICRLHLAIVGACTLTTLSRAESERPKT
jgi:hypothetical protein